MLTCALKRSRGRVVDSGGASGAMATFPLKIVLTTSFAQCLTDLHAVCSLIPNEDENGNSRSNWRRSWRSFRHDNDYICILGARKTHQTVLELRKLFREVNIRLARKNSRFWNCRQKLEHQDS
jgi:hypothetical protein